MGTPAGVDASRVASKSYLSKLPDDVIGNVLRLSSERPNRDDWARYLSSSTLSNFIPTIPSLTETTFRVVCDGEMTTEHLGCQRTATLRLSSHFASTVYAGTSFVLLGALLEKVERVEFPPWSVISPEKSATIVRCCHALRSFSAHGNRHHGPLREILESRGKQLHRLEACFDSMEMTRVIVQHCTALRELLMHSHTNALSIVLHALGAQLVKLEIYTLVDADDLDIIRTQCRSLETISLSTAPVHESVHARLLASYNDQLKEADLNAFELENVLIVAEACPDVKVEIVVEDPRVLTALKSRAHTVTLKRSNATVTEMRNGLKHCAGLRHLLLENFYDDEYDVLVRSFSPPMPVLRSLESLIVVYNRCLSRRELVFLSTCTNGLQWLELRVDHKDSEAISGVKTLIDANSLLTHVKILISNLTPVEPDYDDYDQYDHRRDDGELDYSDDVDDYMVDDYDYELEDSYNDYHEPDEDGEKTICRLLRGMAQCPSLREIVLRSDLEHFDLEEEKRWVRLTSVQDIVANSFRRRRVDIEVFGVSYA